MYIYIYTFLLIIYNIAILQLHKLLFLIHSPIHDVINFMFYVFQYFQMRKVQFRYIIQPQIIHRSK